jgi:hypothetical protein
VTDPPGNVTKSTYDMAPYRNGKLTKEDARYKIT